LPKGPCQGKKAGKGRKGLEKAFFTWGQNDRGVSKRRKGKPLLSGGGRVFLVQRVKKSAKKTGKEGGDRRGGALQAKPAEAEAGRR